MKNFPLLLTTLILLTGCGRPQPTDTVESLMVDPERLKVLREQCKTDRPTMGDELCNRVAEATGRRFLGKDGGKVPYTPSKEQPKF